MALNPYPVEHDLKRELKRQELKAEATDFNCFQDLSPETLTDLLNAIEKADRELKLKLATMPEEERSTRDQWYRKEREKQRKQMIKHGCAELSIYPGDWPESPDDSLIEIKAEEGYIFPWDVEDFVKQQT